MDFRRLRRVPAPALVSLLLGLVISMQVRTQVRVVQLAVPTRVSEETVAQLLGVNQERERLAEELRGLKEAASRQAGEAELQAQLQAELLQELASAGLMEVRGPGVTITLAGHSSRESARHVTEDDVMMVLNELRAGGAEAIAINETRVTPRTSVLRSNAPSGALLLGGMPLNPPVRFAAVGPPALLAASLQMRGGVVQQLTPWMRVLVIEERHLVIPPAAGEPAYAYARPATPEP